MSNDLAFFCIVLSAICTFSIRLFPFILLGGKKEVPQKIKYLGRILPAAIMAVLIVYCLKDVYTDFWATGLYKVIAVIVCVLIHLWRKNSLLSIIISTAVYMILCNI